MDFYDIRVHKSIAFDTFWEQLELLTSLPVKQHIPTSALLIGYEIKAHRPHFQGIIYTDISIDTLRKRIKKSFQLVGNTDYSLASVRNLESALSYAIKEGSYRTTANFETLVRPINQIAPWVDSEVSFDDQVKELDQRYLDSSMDDDSYLNSLLTIYAKSDKRALQLHHIRAHWSALFNKRDRLSVRRITTYNGYEEIQYHPRQLLVDSIKNFIFH